MVYINRISKTFFLVAFAVFMAAGVIFAEEHLPVEDSERPIYQLKGLPLPFGMWIGGKYAKVQRKPAETLAEAKLRQQIKDMERDAQLEREQKELGYSKMSKGSMALAAGIIATIVLAHWGFEAIGVIVALGGVSMIISGATDIKLADHTGSVVIGAISVFVVILIFFFTHGRGASISKAADKLKSIRKRVKENDSLKH